MTAYKNIDEFIFETFPQEVEQTQRRKNTEIEDFEERRDAHFDKELSAIIDGKDPKITKN